jgi:hypothetical protein
MKVGESLSASAAPSATKQGAMLDNFLSLASGVIR